MFDFVFQRNREQILVFLHLFRRGRVHLRLVIVALDHAFADVPAFDLLEHLPILLFDVPNLRLKIRVLLAQHIYLVLCVEVLVPEDVSDVELPLFVSAQQLQEPSLFLLVNFGQRRLSLHLHHWIHLLFDLVHQRSDSTVVVGFDLSCAVELVLTPNHG